MDINTLNSEITYCREVLKKTIIDDVNIEASKPYKYRELARKYLYMDYIDNKRMCVHHLNGDRNDNRLCNLVVVTFKEHKLLHKTFFNEEWRNGYKKASNANKGNQKCTNRSMLGKHHSAETKRKMSEAHKGITHTEDIKKKISNSLKGHTPWNKGIKTSS